MEQEMKTREVWNRAWKERSVQPARFAWYTPYHSWYHPYYYTGYAHRNYEQHHYQLEEARRYDKTGLACGIVGLFFASFIFGPLALYYGKKARALDPTRGAAGIALGAIEIGLLVFVFTFVLILLYPYL